MNNVRMVKLGDVLTQRKEKIFVEDPLQTKLISVRLYGKGALQREIGDGKVPKAFTGYIGHTGQLVLSRIWARKGAIALIPHDLEGVVVTNEFPLFDVDETQVIPKYLIQLLTSNNFGPTLERASSGSSGQNRVRENKFLEISISLPPLEEQKRIVSILDKAKSIQEARERQLAALDELASSLFQSANRLSNTKVTLGEVLSFSSRSIIPGAEHQNMPNIGPDCIEPNTGFLKGWRTIQEDSAISAKYLFTEGDILYSKIRPYLNKVSIADFTGLCSSEIYPLTVKKEIANTYYITYLLRSRIFLQYSELNSTGANIPRINKSNIEKFEFELPDLNIQNIFAEKIKKILHTRSFVQSSLEEYKLLLRSLQSSLFIH
ncbi:restriction endonuclease subunit S [Rothia dentocariosa]|uniref:restriction endonuclease subunit S n=1 Tax=Rothia dentocariosa TaxID=2047 RepID=UPI0010717F80|nr:restriction endonuclease subunit S [Rothia dentocariosa]TFI38784.1 restriction endonuclease subunit S [Rothia dentocariosa]